jgi:HK97 family phage major capsid protein
MQDEKEFPMSKLTNELDRKNRLVATATELVTRTGLKTPADRAEHARLTAELDIADDMIRMLRKVDEYLPQGSQAPAPVVAAPSVIAQRDSAENRKKVNDAARQYFRHGMNFLNPEQRALLTTSDAAGGALVSQSFDEAFVEASKFYGPIFNLVHRKDSATGEPTKFVVADGTSQTFSLLTEGTTSANSVAQQPTLFSDITDTDTLVSSTVYSIQEADDAFDLTAFLMRIAGLAVSRARETAITLGTTNDGTATALPSTPTGGLLATVGAGVTQTTGELAAGPTYAQLNALAGSVDRSYYQSGAFMSSVAVETFLRGQVDSTGRPLYPVDPNTGLLTIAGRLLYPNTALTAGPSTASSPLVLFGDYSKQWVVQNAGVRLKVIGPESPVLNLLTRQLVVWTRLGQAAGLSNAVKSLVSAAS